jgi:hypothetical protein
MQKLQSLTLQQKLGVEVEEHLSVKKKGTL